MILRLVFFLLLLPHLAFGQGTATAQLTINVAQSTTLTNGTYVLTNGTSVVAVDATANPPTAIAATYLSPQQWIWDGTRFDSVSRKGTGTEFLADGNSGLPTMNGTGDTWTTVANGVGWTFQNARTGNYLTIQTGTGTLKMIAAGTQTPTVWIIVPAVAITPTALSLTTGTTGTVTTFSCFLVVSARACVATPWTSTGLPGWLALNSVTGVLTITSTPIVGSSTFTVSDGIYGPQTVSLSVTSSSTLASGSYTLSNGGNGSIAVGGSFGNTPNMFASNGSSSQQWTWDSVATTWVSVFLYPNFPSYLSDNNAGFPLTGDVIDTWSVVANGSGWNIKDLRTNNYLTIQTGTGTLKMIPSGTQTPTVWTAGLVVAPPPTPTALLSANPTSVITGGSSVLTWSSTNASSCAGSNFSTGGATGNPTPATATVFPTAPQVTYGINCGGATASVTIPVTGANTANLTATPGTIAPGGSSVLTWTSNASSCSSPDFATGGAGNNTSPGVTVTPGATTTYHLTCGDATVTTLVTVTTSSGAACPGGDSGFVPAGYQCVLADTDEFSGSSGGVTYNDGDTINGKWYVHVSGYVPSMIQGGGYLADGMFLGGTFNGSTGAGLIGLFNLPDAPSYIEWRRRNVPAQTYGALTQLWTANSIPNQSGGPSTQEETDSDMGEGCGGRGAVPGQDPPGNCAGWADWSNPSAPQFFDFAYGTIPVSDNSAWHIIGMQRLTTPSPNGSVVITVDGTVQHTFTDMPIYYAFPSLGHTGGPDVFIHNLFCANPSSAGGCPNNMEVDIDYIRVYTPCGNVVC